MGGGGRKDPKYGPGGGDCNSGRFSVLTEIIGPGRPINSEHSGNSEFETDMFKGMNYHRDRSVLPGPVLRSASFGTSARRNDSVTVSSAKDLSKSSSSRSRKAESTTVTNPHRVENSARNVAASRRHCPPPSGSRDRSRSRSLSPLRLENPASEVDGNGSERSKDLPASEGNGQFWACFKSNFLFDVDDGSIGGRQVEIPEVQQVRTYSQGLEIEIEGTRQLDAAAADSRDSEEFAEIGMLGRKAVKDFDIFNDDSMSLSNSGPTNSVQNLGTASSVSSLLDLPNVSPTVPAASNTTFTTGTGAQQEVFASPKSPPYCPASYTSEMMTLVKQQRLSQGFSTDMPPSPALPRLSGSRVSYGGGSSSAATSGTGTGTRGSNESIPIVESRIPSSSNSQEHSLSQRNHEDIVNLQNAFFEQNAGHKEHEQHLVNLYHENDERKHDNDERKRDICAIQQRQQQQEQAHVINQQNGATPQEMGIRCPDCGRLYKSSVAQVLKKHRGNTVCKRNQEFDGFQRGGRGGGGGAAGANLIY